MTALRFTPVILAGALGGMVGVLVPLPFEGYGMQPSAPEPAGLPGEDVAENGLSCPEDPPPFEEELRRLHEAELERFTREWGKPPDPESALPEWLVSERVAAYAEREEVAWWSLDCTYHPCVAILLMTESPDRHELLGTLEAPHSDMGAGSIRIGDRYLFVVNVGITDTPLDPEEARWTRALMRRQEMLYWDMAGEMARELLSD